MTQDDDGSAPMLGSRFSYPEPCGEQGVAMVCKFLGLSEEATFRCQTYYKAAMGVRWSKDGHAFKAAVRAIRAEIGGQDTGSDAKEMLCETASCPRCDLQFAVPFVASDAMGEVAREMRHQLDKMAMDSFAENG